MTQPGKSVQINVARILLGLAIVQSIIETHHGHVGVKSDESATTFTVTIPLQQPKDQKGHLMVYYLFSCGGHGRESSGSHHGESGGH